MLGVSAIFCLTITEISYLVRGLFHELVQHLGHDICNAMVLDSTFVPWSWNKAKGATPAR